VNTQENEQQGTVVLSCRVSPKFAALVKKYCQMDSHVNPADLLRDSIREKIAATAPRLYAEMFEERHVCGECGFWTGKCPKHINKVAGDAACSDFKEHGFQ
jgi:hypothetical protein